MKRWTAVLMLAFLAGCGGGDPEPDPVADACAVVPPPPPPHHHHHSEHKPRNPCKDTQ